MSYKIAVDVQVGTNSIEYLQRKNIVVIYKANESQTDEAWFNKALELGANVFVSPDKGIANRCKNNNVFYIKLKQKLKGLQQAYLIQDKLATILNGDNNVNV